MKCIVVSEERFVEGHDGSGRKRSSSLSCCREPFAFEIFIGTTRLIGTVTDAFLQGIDAVLAVSFLLLLLAGGMSWIRGREERSFGYGEAMKLIRLPGAIECKRISPSVAVFSLDNWRVSLEMPADRREISG
jgi:hypothetical protein